MHLLAQIIHAGTEDSTFHLDHVLETVDDGIDNHGVAIDHLELGQFELLDIEDRLHTAVLTEHA